MSDCFNAITLAVWVYVLIPFWMVWGYYWIKDKRAKRRERQRIDELIAELERVQQRITHATVQGQDVIARLQQVRDSLAESRSLRNRYEELAASYRARIERFDFVEEGHALTAHREPATTC
ncbi:hypothetical protein U6J68_12720, partial [Cutibacterium acnes]